MPRRKITTAPAFDVTNLPDLTGQQSAFVQGILAGKTASDAYRAAYDATDMLQQTVWQAASRLRNSPTITEWIDAAKLAGLCKATVTYEGHIEELERLKTIAVRTGNLGAAVQCEQIRGKAAGLHIDKVQDVTVTDAAETLRTIAQSSPELAASLAAQYGIEWSADPQATKH